LVRFTGKEEDCKVVLDWLSASEEAFSHYEVERSTDGLTFEQIANIAGQGGDLSFAYQFTDEKANAKNYYRLKIVDQDGSFEYSNIEVVNLECNNSAIKVYPNPSNGQDFVSVDFKNINDLVSISIFDIAGKRIKVISYEANNDQTIFDVSDLSEGTYLLNFHYGGKLETIKFVKIE